MKMSEITSMTVKDVDLKVDELKTQMFDLKIQKFTSGIEKTHERKNAKKDIARLLTQKSKLLNEGK